MFNHRKPVTETTVKKDTIDTSKFVKSLTYYERINLYIALLKGDDPSMTTDDAYVHAVCNWNGENGLQYYLDRAIHMTSYKERK